MLRDGENVMGWRGKCHGMERKMLRPVPSVPRGAADSSGEVSVSYSPPPSAAVGRRDAVWDKCREGAPCPLSRNPGAPRRKVLLTASAKSVRGSSSPGLDGQRGVNRVREGVKRVREGVNRVREDVNVCSGEGEMQGSAQLGCHEPLLRLLRAPSGFSPRNLGAHIAHKPYGVASRLCWECQGPALHGMLGVLVGVMVWM